MGIFSGIRALASSVASSARALAGRAKSALIGAVGRVKDRRAQPPEPPAGYNPPEPPTPPPPPKPDYTAFYEHRDELTSILYRLDMPSDFIQAIIDMPIEEYADGDFMTLNAALEKLQRYVDAYEQGILPQSVDLDYYAYQIGEALGFDYYEYGSGKGGTGYFDDIPF